MEGPLPNCLLPVENCKALGGRLAYPVTARQRESYLELLEADTLWVLKLRSVNMTKGQCPALVAGQSHLRTAANISHLTLNNICLFLLF